MYLIIFKENTWISNIKRFHNKQQCVGWLAKELKFLHELDIDYTYSVDTGRSGTEITRLAMG